MTELVKRPPSAGWLNLTSGNFVEAPDGHTSALLRDPTTFGFSSIDEIILIAVEWSDVDGNQIALFGKSEYELSQLLDGDEKIWQTLYDRRWIRIVNSRTRSEFGLVVEDTQTAYNTVRLLTSCFLVGSVFIDLYDRASMLCSASYVLDADALPIFLRYGQLLRKWQVY
jgi:hypothetical protein